MPMDLGDYPPYWKKLSYHIRFVRARGFCEGSPGFYEDCQAQHGHPHPTTGSNVVLTVAHLDHDTQNNRFSNLRAMCQRCHLTYDAKYHAANRAKNNRANLINKGQKELDL